MDDADDALIVAPQAEPGPPPEPDPAAELSVAMAEAKRLEAEVAALIAHGEGPGGGLIMAPGAGLSAASMKQALAGRRSILLRKEQELRGLQERMRALLEDQVAALRRSLDPVMAQVRLLEEGIATVNLYLGRDEEIVCLRGGQPAPQDTPITVRQLVLYADEECMVAIDEGGIDAQHLDSFDEWLLARPEHLQQVLPEEKGVVVLMPRRRSRERGDAWIDSQQRAADHHSYWIARNGQRLYRLSTDFEVGERLVPRQDEFTAMFYEDRLEWDPEQQRHIRERVPIPPGSAAWLQAEKSADAQHRHYFRVALVLQGLIDRTTVFHPLPEEGLSLLRDEAYLEGKVRVICDADQVLEDGSERFSDWLRRLNGQLRPGMRVIGSFDGPAFRQLERERGGNSRLYPPHASAPKSSVLHTLDERRRDGGLVFHYRRTDRIWDDYTGREHEAQKRASCVVYPRDDFILPFDLVTVGEMEHYLGLRTARKDYIVMVPLLQAAIAAKRAEAEEERDFRSLLAIQIARQSGITGEAAAQLVPDLVEHWKVANRWHRALRGAPEAEAKALRMILQEERLRRRAGERGLNGDERAVARLVAAAPDFVLIGRERSGRYVALRPQEEGQRVFCQRLSTGTRSERVEVRDWVLPANGWKRWRLLRSTKAWEEWDHAASLQRHLTGPERSEVVSFLRGLDPGRWRDAITVDESGRDGSAPAEVVRPQPVAVTASPANDLLSGMQLTVFFWVPPPVGSGLALSGHHPPYEVPTRGIQWRRGAGGRVVITPSSRTWSVRVERYRGQAEAERPWTQGHQEVLWVEEALLPQVATDIQAYEAGEAARGRLRNQVRGWVRDIEGQWTERAEAAAYQRFLEDFQDVELWEGHRKTLRINVPRGVDDALDEVLEVLVEREVEVAGLSVAEATTLARSLDPGFEETGWRRRSHYDLTDLAPVLELRFRPRPGSAGEED